MAPGSADARKDTAILSILLIFAPISGGSRLSDGPVQAATSSGKACDSMGSRSRQERSTDFAQEWHLPQQVPTPSDSRKAGMDRTPSSTALRIRFSETLWQIQTIMVEGG